MLLVDERDYPDSSSGADEEFLLGEQSVEEDWTGTVDPNCVIRGTPRLPQLHQLAIRIFNNKRQTIALRRTRMS